VSLKDRVEQILRGAGIAERTETSAGYYLTEQGQTVIVRWRESRSWDRQTGRMRMLFEEHLRRPLRALEQAGFGVDRINDGVGYCILVFDKPGATS